ncbi:MAG: flagellar filament capping protein FliD [Lachnospiraceae bacterium]|nr:flagellar filament capping protein FliD [Lachnospiraceae bacterium]
MSSIDFYDYMSYTNMDTGYDVSALMGGASNSCGNLLSDYASIKNGSYGRMMKAYCAKREKEMKSVSGDTAQKLTLMRSGADSLKKSADALGNSSLWEKKKITKKNEETGEETETEDYDWEAITRAVKSFVEDYNSVVEQAGNSDTKNVLRNAVWMTGMTEKTEKLLSRVGISIGKGNKLELDEDALKKANVSELKSLFTGHGSFADKVSQKAGAISRAASSAAAAAKTKTTYTRNGNYSDTLSKLYSGAVDQKVGEKKEEKNRNKDSDILKKALEAKEDKKKEIL